MEIITFGKYKNWPVMDVIDLHPGYIIWACNNIGFQLTEWQKKELHSRLGHYTRDDDEFAPDRNEFVKKGNRTMKKVFKTTIKIKVTAR